MLLLLLCLSLMSFEVSKGEIYAADLLSGNIQRENQCLFSKTHVTKKRIQRCRDTKKTRPKSSAKQDRNAENQTRFSEVAP